MSEYTTIDDYVNDFDGKGKEYLMRIRAIMHELIPDLTELINYNIPAFAMVQGGKREEQIMMAGYNKHIGFYPHPTTMENFWDKLDEYKRAKGSVQFPFNKPLPEELIKDMVLYRLDLLKNQKGD